MGVWQPDQRAEATAQLVPFRSEEVYRGSLRRSRQQTEASVHLPSPRGSVRCSGVPGHGSFGADKQAASLEQPAGQLPGVPARGQEAVCGPRALQPAGQQSEHGSPRRCGVAQGQPDEPQLHPGAESLSSRGICCLSLVDRLCFV
uniref:Uncharacterized protein n=1 Tax=Zea mays TaxID=4577 RepID=B4FVX9_MAIZE|nr:unknown [Zea mays]